MKPNSPTKNKVHTHTHIDAQSSAMAATTACSSITTPSFLCFSSSLSFKPINSHRPVSHFSSLQSFTPKFSRLIICNRQRTVSEDVFRVPRIFCAVEDNSEPESVRSEEASIDIKLPRRSLLVSFTCDACGVRSQRFINRVAYERGTVFLQCSGCLQYHKFVDNLGLVVEYNLLEDGDVNSSADLT